MRASALHELVLTRGTAPSCARPGQPLAAVPTWFVLAIYCSMGEQQGFSTGFGSINSTRVKFGSYMLNCHLPSLPAVTVPMALPLS